MRETNALIKPMADGRSVIYVDLFEAFLDGDKLKPAYTSDGIHISGAGYAAWITNCESAAPRA